MITCSHINAEYRMVGIFIQPGIYKNNGPKDVLKDLHFSYPQQFVFKYEVSIYT